MVTVSELIEHLQTLPQNGVVRVLEEYSRDWETSIRFTNLTIPYSIFVWERYGKTFVDIGEN